MADEPALLDVAHTAVDERESHFIYHFDVSDHVTQLLTNLDRMRCRNELVDVTLVSEDGEEFVFHSSGMCVRMRVCAIKSVSVFASVCVLRSCAGKKYEPASRPTNYNSARSPQPAPPRHGYWSSPGPQPAPPRSNLARNPPRSSARSNFFKSQPAAYNRLNR